MNKKQILNWLAVILWLGVIYFFSHQPDLKSELEPFWDFVFRKIAHISEYFVLAYLLFRALSSHNLKNKKAIFMAVIFSVIYAGLDEWHQSFIQNRVASPIDVGIDGVGALVFVFLKSLNSRG